MMKRALFAVLLALLPLSTNAATHVVRVLEPAEEGKWGFTPEHLNIQVGDTVEFVNDGKAPHTFTAVDRVSFDSPQVEAGQRWTFTFRKAGVFEYLCLIHPQMVAQILVEAPSAGPVGQFFTETGGGGGRGYWVTDDGGIRFWSEFQRLGGVQAVGYPASQRFQWDGFTVQVFQRVIFQWRPDLGGVAFVNVFDRMNQLGRDDFLLSARQTPKHDPTLGDIGPRLLLLDARPAIKAAYFSVVGDPLQANGAPTSRVMDMGNHYALRAQRVVFQEWKEDVPWARRGQVTVALGGDISKEAGVLPDQAALQPVARTPS